LILGVVLGWLWPEGSQQLKVVSNVFLRLIKCLLVPLVFSTLVVGIAGHGDDLKAVGRLALRSILYFEAVTTLALVIGLGAVNLARPGQGISLPPAGSGTAIAAQQATWQDIVEHIVPRSFFEAAAANDVLQVVCFAILFAAALSQVRGQPHDTMVGFCESLMELMFKFVGVVMKFAPFGVGAAMAYTVAHSGWSAIASRPRSWPGGKVNWWSTRTRTWVQSGAEPGLCRLNRKTL
jgi:proton glutamate symport protein